MTRVIALIGFMGSGKSTIGPLLAEALGESFVDLDDIITAAAGKSVGDIFAEEGEAGWRRRERQALADVLSREGVVLSCGGGVVLAEENRAALRKGCLTIYLQASPETLLERLRDSGGRPLLDAGDLEAALRKLHGERLTIYEEAADMKVSTDKKTPGDLTREILSKIEDEFDNE